jgi:hypothetical protein
MFKSIKFIHSFIHSFISIITVTIEGEEEENHYDCDYYSNSQYMYTVHISIKQT